jgi:hypothetical protein
MSGRNEIPTLSEAHISKPWGSRALRGAVLPGFLGVSRGPQALLFISQGRNESPTRQRNVTATLAIMLPVRIPAAFSCLLDASVEK